MKVAVLQLLCETTAHVHKTSLIGLPGGGRAHLEHHLGIDFEVEEQALARRAFDELESAGLIYPTYQDVADPTGWYKPTGEGVARLQSGLLDPLDAELQSYDEGLVEKREAAWSSLRSGTPGSVSQAAHSCREFMLQLFRRAAPTDRVKGQEGFVPDPKARDGVTHAHRYQFLLVQRRGSDWESDPLGSAAYSNLRASYRTFVAISHKEDEVDAQHCRAALQSLESALTFLLLE